MKKVIILGSTGSIGVNTLRVIQEHQDKYEILGLATHKNSSLLESQARKFNPRIVSLYDDEAADKLQKKLIDLDIEVWKGLQGTVQLATHPEADLIVSAIVGAAGLIPTYAAIKARKRVALANKETLVMAGELIAKEADMLENIIPIDSEHSALFQSLTGVDKKDIKRIILTASGGPLRHYTAAEMERVSLAEALKHPNWAMGKKITIDSATLMNKGFEVIEARWLFDMPQEKIEVTIHHQSIVHSMVEFIDGAVIAQLGIPDMRIPIAYALSYPERLPNQLPPLDLTQVGTLTFEKPDLNLFACLRYAYCALEIGNTMPAVLNAANEVAVQAFLTNTIKFLDIPRIIEKAIDHHSPSPILSLEDVLAADQWGREMATSLLPTR
ncbi:MAG: 1-deoxy-D-xylulose-5-phosphate reductoisomerase [Nitrospinae bacterium RIFCSPLOWO2_12_FULL_45_22]|nr:MAG: 1-deoxy-D-xylulose-5-phosphate reductoisomerase [Nitrospinae bacterium RIFCSPLOWO2_12_FULL_45_22]